MTAVLYTEHFVQFFDDNGNPLSGGKLYAYSAGTTTPKATYTTAAATVENAHPIVLDSAGRATIFIQGSYRFDLFDANNALIKSTDNVISFNTLNESGDPFFQSFSGTGAQTVFTLSESLGSDSKDIMVFVDAGAGKGYEIQNPSAYTLSGTSLTFTSAPASGTGNIYVFAPTKLLGAASAAAAAASSAANLQGTSTTSVAIGIGSKSFTTQAGMAFTVGRFVLIVSAANPANYMHGQITAYSGTSLTVNVTNIGGSGTLNDWNITVSGTQGSQGAAGNITNIATQPVATITASDITIFADVSDSNNSKRTTVQGILDLVPAGVLEKVSTTNFAGDATFDVAYTSGYVYRLVMDNIVPSTDDMQFRMRTSSNNGSSYDSGASDYQHASFYQRSSLTTDNEGATAGSAINLTGAGVGNASGEGACFDITFGGLENTSIKKHISFKSSFLDSTTVLRTGFGSGNRNSNSAITNLRFYFASGNIASGKATLYRMAV